MENIQEMPLECAYQFFYSDDMQRAELFEKLTLAHIYAEHLGPVIMICTEGGYDFLVRNNLDEFYIDILICEDGIRMNDILYQLKTNDIIRDSQFINSLKTCPENLRILYKESSVAPKALQKIRAAIEAEENKNKI